MCGIIIFEVIIINISIATSFDYSIPIKEQFIMIARNCFNYVSIGGNYLHSGIINGKTLEIKQIANDNNLNIDTVHGYNLDKPDAVLINAALAKAASLLESKVMVVHCSPFAFDPITLENRKKDIMSKIFDLTKIASDNNIIFALENVLPGVPTDLAVFILENSDPRYFSFCYDSAHDQIDGPRPFTLLDRVAKRVAAVHLSDRSEYEVDHQVPGEGFIDFKIISKRLQNERIIFPLLMEVMITHSKYKNPDIFLAETYKQATKIYRDIYDS
jgi:Sugar phosphate isomerases/epimerases